MSEHWAAGWYTSEREGWLRYWDGSSWTSDYTPTQSTSDSSQSPSPTNPGGRVTNAESSPASQPLAAPALPAAPPSGGALPNSTQPKSLDLSNLTKKQGFFIVMSIIVASVLALWIGGAVMGSAAQTPCEAFSDFAWAHAKDTTNEMVATTEEYARLFEACAESGDPLPNVP